jgi:hypothetical protein
MGSIPGWAWLALIVVAVVLCLRMRRPGSDPANAPITPGYTGSGDRTVQRPKARPWSQAGEDLYG